MNDWQIPKTPEMPMKFPDRESERKYGTMRIWLNLIHNTFTFTPVFQMPLAKVNDKAFKKAKQKQKNSNRVSIFEEISYINEMPGWGEDDDE